MEVQCFKLKNQGFVCVFLGNIYNPTPNLHHFLNLKIKNMLYEQSFTIAGAKKKLKEESNQKRVSTKVNVLLHEILGELKSIKQNLG